MITLPVQFLQNLYLYNDCCVIEVKHREQIY